MSSINAIIDSYYKWLREKTIIEVGNNDWYCIDTPFMGAFNDSIEIYVKKKGGSIVLSDDGQTLNNLELQGVNIQRSKKRHEILNTIVLNYGLQKRDNNELILKTDAIHFPQKKHNFLTAILEIGDVSVLSEHNVGSIFKEDVQEYLNELGIIYTPEFISKGTTGLDFTFDFQIAKKEKEIVIKSFNSINKSTLSNFLFSWEDIKPVRHKIIQKDMYAIAMINDTDRPVGNEYLQALTSKKADFILWSERNNETNRAKIAA